jgi:hypothetical protein
VERVKNTQRIDSRLRKIGFLLGIGVAMTIIAAERIPAGAGVLGADVHIVVAPTGELAMKPSGLVLEGTGLTPATEHATGSFQMTNQTGSMLDVHLRGIPDAAGLDHTLWISVTGPDDEEIYRGGLGGFRDWTATAVTLRPGQSRTIELEAWVPVDVGPGYVGHMAQVDLGFRSVPEDAP